MDRRVFFALALGFLLLLGGLLFVMMRTNGAGPVPADRTETTRTEGERHQGWTPFYYATDGTWKILDDAVYVLKEQKYTSSDRERDEYTVYTLKRGDTVRMIDSQGRWKQVEVMVDGTVVATGWIDAHFIRNAEQVVDVGENEAATS